MRVLNVAEKPSVAKEIAAILSGGRYDRKQGFSPYNAIFEFPYEIQRQSVHMVVTSVTGHLMELEFDPQYRSWYSCDPVELFNAPVLKKTRSDETQKKIEKTLVNEARQCQWLVLWLDCDREGENIAFEVKSICERASRRRLRVLRARFSALIPRDIVHAVQNLAEPDERLSLACDARSEIDLRIGAAFTRFQTVRIQNKFPMLKKEKGVISYGPCQFPTLGFVVERYLQIQNFEREAFHYIAVTHERQDLPEKPKTTFNWRRGRVYDRVACLCIYEGLLEQPTATIVAVDKRPTWKRKPLPLTTVELQKKAATWLRVSSEQTMKAAESLYNKGFISYPRTETNKFKEGTDLMGLLRQHESHAQWGNYVSRELLQNGKFEEPRAGGADDQAHPPIHPTKCVALNSINDPIEKKIYEFVTLHFLACCSRDARGDQTSVQMKILHEQFTAKGLMVLERNYLDIYKYEKWSTSTIPVYNAGDTFRPTAIEMQSGETAPPPLLSEADLIAKMDANGIGTDATIAEHIKTILKREYATKVNNDTQFEPTTLGLALVLSYEHMGLELAKPTLRAAMEDDCKAIALGRKDMQTVIRTCMEQMEQIFRSVNRNADILDETFAEHFGRAPQVSAPSMRPAISNRPPPSAPSRSPPQPQQNASWEAEDDIADDDNEPGWCGSVHRGQVRAPPASTPAPTPIARQPPRPAVHDVTSQTPRCTDHGMECVERTVQREGSNKGRSFFSCPLPQNERCSFFAWADSNVGSAQHSVKCTGHNELCVERTVRREGENKGREFYACARPQVEQCGFFQWKDEVQGQTSAPSDPNVPLCLNHQRPCVERTCNNGGENHGRKFYACAYSMSESCGFFSWKDEMGDSNPNPRSAKRPRTTTSNKPDTEPTETGTPKCECGTDSIQLVCRNGANKGRVFFKCSGNGQENQCSFFQWGT
ncbi:hypothetical protein Poli38472_008475 [Pythium oligandrum]|uniref:DNA topoisomerase n=1 Tax=Pythium oligandrum TaxID=41045 RepID=A0A8K1C477_PYTOL|nr:hypothetical protein Poli38472_008475 [Pythium oligandrum]|eukprot:TMW55827.1 hypothetical protein Poli38472_008475 [Pythium oligandrum]